MCGVIGVVTGERELGYIQKMLFKTLVLVDTERGKDSTGVCILTKNEGKKKIICEKDVGDGYTFVEKGKLNFLDSQDGMIVAMGHNRSASVGRVTIENAHPFILNGVDFGCHNGTFSRDIGQFLNTQDFEVDSLVVLNKIAKDKEKKNVVDAIKDNLRKVVLSNKGNFAILYAEGKTEKMYAFREEKKPLYAVQTIDNCCWFVSEMEIFRKSYSFLRMIDQKLPPYQDYVQAYERLEPYYIYSAYRGKLDVEGQILTKQEIEEKRKRETDRFLFQSLYDTRYYDTLTIRGNTKIKESDKEEELEEIDDEWEIVSEDENKKNKSSLTFRRR